MKLQIWDTAGEKSLKYVAETNIKGSSGILLVYNITDRASFENLNAWLTEIKNNAEKDTGIILVGTNCDLEEERKVTYQEGKDFAESNKMKFIEVSAKNNINVKEAFETLVEDIFNSNPNIKTVDEMQIPFHPTLPKKNDGFCNVY